MTRVVILGDDRGLADALEERGATVSRAEGTTVEELVDAGLDDADAFVLTDVDDATALVVASEVNPEARMLVYAEGSLPDFAATVADLLVEPELLGVEAVAEEIAGGASGD